MKILLLGLLVLCNPVSSTSTQLSNSSPAKPSPFEILETGEFHGNEVRAKSGERWLGLFSSSKHYSLNPVILSVNAVHDEIVDEGTNAQTGKKVSVIDKRSPIFLLKNSGLRPGPATTVMAGERALTNGENIEFSLGARVYHLMVVTKDKIGPELGKGSQLALSTRGSQQVLFSLPNGGNDPSWSLIWAGDIDGDGKLDLYLNLSDHYNVSSRRLFLSGSAEAGNMVKEVAVFSTTGC